jgi:uncharacterized protein with HEPN domain
MRHEARKYLDDILSSISNIEKFVGEPKLFENFNNNALVVRAVEREFEIIGEAANRLRKIYPNIEITNIKGIINLRNRVIHAYDSIDNTVLWAIIINHLPKLKSEIKTLIKQYQ